MSVCPLILLKRFRFDKSKEKEKSESDYTWSASESCTALDTYSYKGNTYVVASCWSYEGSGDMADSDHYWSLYFKVYPIPTDYAENESKVLEITENSEGFHKSISDNIPLSFSDEEAFTISMRYRIPDVIDAYLANEARIRREQEEKKLVPNAVMVYDSYLPTAEVIYDFSSDAGIGTVFYNCTKLRIVKLDEESQQNLGISRKLCYCSPDGRGCPTVSAYTSTSDNFGTITFRRNNRWDTGDRAIICAFEKNKPAPLTPDEVQTILDFVNSEA